MGKFIDVFYHLQLKFVRFWGEKDVRCVFYPLRRKVVKNA